MMRYRTILWGTIVLVLALAGPVAAQSADVPAPLNPAEKQLHEAAYTGRLDMVKALVEQGKLSVDVADEQKRTPMMWAAFNGHTAVVQYLFDRGAAIKATDEVGRSSLMYAASGPHRETVALLIDKGAVIDRREKTEGFTSLMFAAAEGQAEVVQLLLEFGADPDIEDIDGDDARSMAAKNGHVAVAEALKSASESIARSRR